MRSFLRLAVLVQYGLRCAVYDLNVKRIVTTKIEHHAVPHTASVERSPERGNYFLATDHNGNPVVQLESIINDKVNTLVTLMHANNEIGTLLPIKR